MQSEGLEKDVLHKGKARERGKLHLHHIKMIIRDREGYYIMIKRSIHQEDITTINIYATIMRVKQIITDLNNEIDNSTILVGDSETPLSSMDRSYRQKINIGLESKIRPNRPNRHT